VLWQSLRVEFEHDGHRRSRIILSVAALKFAHEKKSSIRPGDALIAHASTFIEKNRLFKHATPGLAKKLTPPRGASPTGEIRVREKYQHYS